MSDQIDEQLALIRREIDALKIAPPTRATPWYRNVSVILSVVALLFSFGTTVVSYKRANDQEVQSTRQELRGLLQRLAALPKDNLEATKKYSNDPASIALISGFINNEMSLLSRQAAALAKRLPKGTVSPAEYHSVAMALQGVSELASAKEFFQLAVETAQTSKDFNTEIGARRGLANLYFLTGAPEDGRIEYQRARDIFSRYPDYDQFTKVSTQVFTELSWAGSERYMGSSTLVAPHLAKAQGFLSDLPPSPLRDIVNSQVAQQTAQETVTNPLGQSLPSASPLPSSSPLRSAKPMGR